MTTMAKEVSLSIPAGPRMELAATAQAEVMGELISLSRNKIDEVKLALVEACINAFEHGAGEEDSVDLTFRVAEGPSGPMLEIAVSDHGTGFDPGRVEPPEIGKKLNSGRRKRGWGLKLIRGMMDDVEIRSTGKGTTVVMRKYR